MKLTIEQAKRMAKDIMTTLGVNKVKVNRLTGKITI